VCISEWGGLLAVVEHAYWGCPLLVVTVVHWFGVVCAPATRAGVYAWRDVPYGAQASAPNPKLTLDVFVPKAPPFPRPLLPVLVFVHGECGSCLFGRTSSDEVRLHCGMSVVVSRTSQCAPVI
jgi:hypothetical protein